MSRDKGIIVKDADPSVDDDVTKGFWVGFKWINTVAETEFTCISVAQGAAVWKKVLYE